MKFKLIAAALVATISAAVLSGCGGSASSAIESTAAPTGAAGFTAKEAEQYFYKTIPDARSVNCSIRNDGTYSVTCSLCDEKSETKDNYDDFAISVKNACESFSKVYSAEAKIFTIFFFLDDGGRIYWQSLDGINGTLYEEYGDYYNHEEKYSFSELVDFYSQYH